MIRYAGAWKDLGTWGALCEEFDDSIAGDAWLDDETVTDVHVVNECEVPVVVAGMSHAVGVAPADGILVAGKDADARVRDLVNRAALPAPMCERVGWGTYRVVASGVRELIIEAGRDAEWANAQEGVVSFTVTQGVGKLASDCCGADACCELRPGSCVRVERGQVLAIHAMSEMRVIEVRCDACGDE